MYLRMMTSRRLVSLTILILFPVTSVLSESTTVYNETIAPTTIPPTEQSRTQNSTTPETCLCEYCICTGKQYHVEFYIRYRSSETFCIDRFLSSSNFFLTFSLLLSHQIVFSIQTMHRKWRRVITHCWFFFLSNISIEEGTALKSQYFQGRINF